MIGALVLLSFYLGTYALKIMYQHRLSNIHSELSYYNQAIEKFYKKYGYFPGDFPDASDLWLNTKGGNGNNQVEELLLEDVYAWQHLYLAGLIDQEITDIHGKTNNHYSPGKNAPVSEEINRGFYAFKYINKKIYATTGHALILGRKNHRGYPVSGILSSKDAFLIDKKYDDGKPFSGSIITVPEDQSTGCVKKDPTGYYAEYLQTTTINCVLYQWVDKDN